MGFFDALFGRKQPPAGKLPDAERKLKLIRSFIKKRTIQDPMASLMGFSPDMVDGLPLPMLMGMPEAKLVTIVEAFATLKHQGMNDAKAFQHIERSRPDSYPDDIPAGAGIGCQRSIPNRMVRVRSPTSTYSNVLSSQERSIYAESANNSLERTRDG